MTRHSPCEARFDVALHERWVGKLLRRLGFARLSVRPKHPSSDPEAQEAFKKTFAQLVQEALPEHAAGQPVEIWFQDEGPRSTGSASRAP